ncbi:MAG: F0F1 ATP synthase subunit A [Methylocystis sp.]
MIASPLELQTAFHIGSIGVTKPVVTTWALMAFLVAACILATAHLESRPGTLQSIAELIVDTVDAQTRDIMRIDPAPYRALFGTLFLFILAANWSALIPGVEPPTARLETDMALALVVFAATIFYGIKTRGVFGYLKSFAEPSLIMVPLNLVEQITHTFSLFVRLFGNVMSGVFVVGIVLTLAGLLVPIPLMALDLLTGAVQAYIFTILAMVFTAAAVIEDKKQEPTPPPEGVDHGSD